MLSVAVIIGILRVKKTNFRDCLKCLSSLSNNNYFWKANKNNTLSPFFTTYMASTGLTATDAASFRCSRHTESAWSHYLGGRVDEGSQYDCPRSSHGGQCVALLKCKCGLPGTYSWQADVKVGRCDHIYCTG